jgi:hypothetical protein
VETNNRHKNNASPNKLITKAEKAKTTVILVLIQEAYECK